MQDAAAIATSPAEVARAPAPATAPATATATAGAGRSQPSRAVGRRTWVPGHADSEAMLGPDKLAAKWRSGGWGEGAGERDKTDGSKC